MRPVLVWLMALLAAPSLQLESARDHQDKAALAAAVASLEAAARKSPQDAAAQYLLARARSYLAEVDLELGDKAGAREAAEAGIRAAERAVALQGKMAEYHRMLGTLCGQAIPANVLLALRYGRCASESIRKAIELDAKSSSAYVSRGVGNYYLPPSLGGGMELAIRDFQKAIELNPSSAEAHLWLGIAWRKVGRNADARSEILRSLELNPNRAWAKQQLQKTPVK